MTDAVIHQLARETARKLQHRIGVRVLSGDPYLDSDGVGIIEAALQHAQQVQREEIVGEIESCLAIPKNWREVLVAALRSPA